MTKSLSIAAASMLIATGAFAQMTTPSAPPANTAPPSTTQIPSTAPSTSAPSTAATTNASSLKLAEADAKALIGKPVFSMDGKSVGTVANIDRKSSGEVNELHADVGGFLGLGQTRVRVTPAQFRIDNQRVVLNMSAEQIKALPALDK